MNTQTENRENALDLLHIAKVLWRKAWIILITTILLGATPQYQAKAMMYVNNSALSLGGTSFSISSSELSAAKSLLDVYVIILRSRDTMEVLLEETGLDYTCEQIAKMITASSVNSTEVFQIVATSSSPEEAELIVDTIVKIIPERIADIVDGSSVRLVERAVLPVQRSSPSYTMYTLFGFILGFVASCGVIIFLEMIDTSIRDVDYLYQRYNIPVLAVVPDAYENKKGSYSYYYSQDAAAEKKEN